ncbi:retrovirus-related pol polyprotein from transposon TNT 1-94 [Tanacetum coccineum]
MMRLKYTDGSPITDHLNAFQGIINQLAGMGIKFEDEIQGLWLLGTLPDTWETFRTSLSNSAPDGVITMELAKGSILNKEKRRKSQGSSSQSDVLVTERRGRSQSRGPSNRGNHRSSSSKGKFADVECYHCHKKGHTMKFCRQLKKENKKKNYNNQKNKHKKDDDGDDNTEVNTTTDEFFVCYDYDMVNLANDDSSWILNSGATCHVATRKDYYSSYTPGDFGVVRMGNTRLSRIAGIGDICLKFDTGMELVLHNVKHVPDMRLNIISTGLLDEDGYHNSSGNGLWKVTLGSLIVARGKRESKLYMTHPKISKSIVNAVDNGDMTELWHKRLGHMSEKGMSILSKKIMLSGVHDINMEKCSHCLAGKQTRLAFKSRSPFRMENILDLRAWNSASKDSTEDTTVNGLAERMNRTLVERVRCLLSHAGLPASLWGEALNTTVHVINLTSCVPLRFDVPDRVWSDKDVSYRHLRVFGCKAFVHIPKDERSKLDVKTKPCVFLGYGQDEFGYKLYDPAERETIPQHNDDLIDLDPGADDVDAQEQPNLDEDVHPELPVPDMPPLLPLRRSTRDHHPSTCYSPHEYVLLTDGGEPECYAEDFEVEQMDVKTAFLHGDLDKEFYMEQPEDEIFSPVVKMGSIRVVLGLAATLDLEVEQMDVKTAFLHGDLDKEIYMEQPEGFQVKEKEGYVCRLQKSLYGLKQAPRQWFNMDKAKVVSSPLTTNFKLTDKDCPSSKKNIEKMDRVPYASAVGSLMYAMVCTRPDLAHAVGVVSRFLSNPGKKHWEAVKWIFRYLRGTSKLGITFGNGKPMLVGFTDSDMAGNKDNMKSTSGYLMTFAGGAVSWQSRLQKCVALSTTEAEYMAATEACKELLWLKRFLQELGFKQQRYAVLCDNQSAIHLAKNSMFHKRTKHIDIRYHWIRDAIEDGMFELNKVHTDDNASDMLTKAVAREKLKLPDIERKVLTVGILILRPGRKMEDLLYVKDYYLPVFTTEKPENKTDAEWTILHRQGVKKKDEVFMEGDDESEEWVVVKEGR